LVGRAGSLCARRQKRMAEGRQQEVTVSKQSSGDQRHRKYVAGIRIAATLLDGPKTLAEILDRSYGYLRPLGLFKRSERQARDRMASVRQRLEELMGLGWIVCEAGRYALTSLGREEANKRLSQLGETGALIREFLKPQAVSKVTLGVHWGLAALKLPAGLLSGSVGLLNDAVDTLLDGLSSLLVYFGIRFNKERTVNIVLVILMLATGLLTLYEAVRRFFVPVESEVGWFAFLAAIFSAVLCLVLWAYQRYVGLRGGVMALITQSVDSRNHIIVAASVTAGLVASLLHFPMLDTLVGLGVALIILKSAIELVIETVRSLGKEEIDLSRFEFGIAKQYNKFRQAQLRDWMLYLVDKQGTGTRAELVARAGRALDFDRIPAARAMGLAQGQAQAAELIERSLAELFQHGWLAGEERLSVTNAGRKHLGKWM
jgi:Co/Zn/Cd efflux system component